MRMLGFNLKLLSENEKRAIHFFANNIENILFIARLKKPTDKPGCGNTERLICSWAVDWFALRAKKGLFMDFQETKTGVVMLFLPILSHF